MRRELIGKVLSKMGKLSEIDIDEILFEQAVTRKRFGDIAIGLGLCDPEHLCDAWCQQVESTGRRIDLHAIGVDPQAVQCLPPEICRRLGVIPIRVLGSRIVLAASRALLESELEELRQILGKDLRTLHVEASEISAAIERTYPSPGGLAA